MAAQPTTPDPVTRTSALPEVAPVSWAVMQLAHAQRGFVAQRLAALGLFPGQELVLAQLWTTDGTDSTDSTDSTESPEPAPGRSQKELCTALGLDHSTVAKSVQRLEKAGLVRRDRSAADGRVTLVRLTDAGRALRQPVFDVWAELEARWAKLDPDDAKRFASLARTLLDQPALPGPAGA